LTPDDVRTLCFNAAKLKMPTFDSTYSPGAKIEKIEDYLLNTAAMRSELEEARLYMHEATFKLKQQYKDMTGWEVHMGKMQTEEAVKRAKRIADTPLCQGIDEGEELIKRLSDQIRRLEHDDEVASRAYTLITGG
jgi:hypothetical protein